MNVLHAFIILMPILGTLMVLRMRPCECDRECKRARGEPAGCEICQDQQSETENPYV